MRKFNIARMFKSVLIIAAVISYFAMLTFKPIISGLGALIFFGIVIFLNIKTKPEDNIPKEKVKEEHLPENKFPSPDPTLDNK